MDQLPDSVLRIILEFVGNTADLVDCTRTCTTWNRLLKNDDGIWKYCEGNHPVEEGQAPEYPNTWRESALLHQALHYCDLYKDFPSSSFIDSLYDRGDEHTWFVRLFSQVMEKLAREVAPNVLIRPSNDLCYWLINVVESYVASQLKRAYDQSVRAEDSSTRTQIPEVTGKVLAFLDWPNPGGCAGREPFCSSLFVSKNGDNRQAVRARMRFMGGFRCNSRRIQDVVRRTGYCAGIPKIDPVAGEVVAGIVVGLLENLLRPAFIEISDREPLQPPPSMVVVHWISNQRVQETAKRMGLNHQVYGVDLEDIAPYEVTVPDPSGALLIQMIVHLDDEESYVDSEQGYEDDEMWDDISHPNDVVEMDGFSDDSDDESILLSEFSSMVDLS